MILHCVFCDFKDGVETGDTVSILRELAQFTTQLDGVLGFDFGPNLDFEGKSKRFNAGFVIRFADKRAADIYATHPTHQALGAQLCDLCTGGADGIMVFDLEI